MSLRSTPAEVLDHQSAPAARRPAVQQWRLAACAAACLALSACGGSGGSGSSDSAAPASAEARGQALYVGTGVDCAQCHVDASTMRRGATGASDLADRIDAAIRSNTGRMGDAQYKLATLTRAEMLDLAAYILSASPPPPPPPPPAPAPAPGPAPSPAPAAAVQCTTTSASTAVRTERFTSGLSSPWAMAFLPDGRVLVTQKAGAMVLVSANGTTRTTLAWAPGGPTIRDGGQGGLLDVALDPDYASSPWIYFSYQEPGPNSTSGTAVGRAQLQGTTLGSFQRLYQQTPKVGQDGVHFGSRLAFRADKTLFVSLGDRGQDDPSSPGTDHAQNLGKTLGKIIRINRDGTIPSDNPFRLQAGALPEIWSLGHRNPQGLAINPANGDLWNTEHGPQGGDELNRVVAGANYAWPLRSYGCPYGSPTGTACRVNGGTHAPLSGRTFNEPVTFWAPTSIAPSNVVLYNGSGFPEWNGSVLIGSLAGQRLWRVALNGNRFASCEPLLAALNKRIRDVRQGPDGWVWVATDDGEIHRVIR
jgi:glucose/arabinose dehydrogenase